VDLKHGAAQLAAAGHVEQPHEKPAGIGHRGDQALLQASRAAARTSFGCGRPIASTFTG
jgi:hypothetical protein